MTYVFVIGIILVVIPATVNGQSVAVVGKNFHYQILRRTYFDPIPDSAVYFKASSTGKPGLPAWLKYIQEDPKMDTAYLYGTPTPSDIGTASIEIVAFNADTYDTKILAITISVEENHVPNSYFVTFNVTNKDVGDMYSPDPNSGKMTIDAFVGTVKTIWSDAQNLAVADITSSLDAGGRVPIPGQPTGVVIQIGSQSDFSSGIKNAAVSPCEASFQIFTDNGFDINWCYFNTTVKEMNDKSTINPSPVVLGAVYVAPVLTVEERDLTTEFILVVIVPLAVAIVLAIILSYIMCARREGVEKRINATPTVQLTHHSHIKNATKELRDMSMRREGAQPLSTLPAFRLSPTPGSRTGQHSPPQDRPSNGDQPLSSTPRGGAPPPYRLPPSFPAQEETSFINQPEDGRGDRRASEPAGLQDDDNNGATPGLSHQPPPFMRGSGEQMYASQPAGEDGTGATSGSKHTIPDTVNEYEEPENEKENLVHREYLT